MWRLVSRARRRLGRSICRFTWHNSTPDSGTITLEAPSTSLSPAEVIFPSLGGNNSKWAGLPAKGFPEPTTYKGYRFEHCVHTSRLVLYCCLSLPHFNCIEGTAALLYLKESQLLLTSQKRNSKNSLTFQISTIPPSNQIYIQLKLISHSKKKNLWITFKGIYFNTGHFQMSILPFSR